MMKIFGFEIKKFEKQTTTIKAAETWIVSWQKIKNDICRFYSASPQFVAFTSEQHANAYAQELRDARNLLGDTDLPVTVYKQEVPTNAGQ
jgi:hypothetical protein